MPEPLDLDTVTPWLAQCGSCDAGLPMACTHPASDYRPMMARLVDEVRRVESLRAELGTEVDQLAVLLDQTRGALRVALHHLKDRPGLADDAAHEEREAELSGCRIALEQATAGVEGAAPVLPGSSRRAQEPDPRRVLAALEVLGWPDDRERSAHVEPDGHEVTLAGHYWETVAEVIRAADEAAPKAGQGGTVSSVIASSNRFARAAAGLPAARDWVSLRTGSGRQYEGERSKACPGDGQPGHRHDIGCVLLDPAPGTTP